MTFPDELARFLQRTSRPVWDALSEDMKRLLVTLGTKLEPIIQITPPTPVPLVLGFESLALGSLGENFLQICRRSKGFDPGLLRLLLTLAALKTAWTLRSNAAQDGAAGVRHLLFTVNLDPEMLACPHLNRFLEGTYLYWENNVLFEVNERTTERQMRRLKDLQVDFNLRFCADDFNNWSLAVKRALADRVEMTKVDHESFRNAMEKRGDDPAGAIAQIAANRIPGKPLVVEGLEDSSHLWFLDRHWSFPAHGHLFGQGYAIEPGRPWNAWTADLRSFGFPGGHILSAPTRSDSRSFTEAVH